MEAGGRLGDHTCSNPGQFEKASVFVFISKICKKGITEKKYRPHWILKTLESTTLIMGLDMRIYKT